MSIVEAKAVAVAQNAVKKWRLMEMMDDTDWKSAGYTKMIADLGITRNAYTASCELDKVDVSSSFRYATGGCLSLPTV
uniref:Uncharacterized protein n=1 Tax=Setaria digitata TaxID=48799 RepID=A0A915PSX9_9BILA